MVVLLPREMRGSPAPESQYAGRMPLESWVGNRKARLGVFACFSGFREWCGVCKLLHR